MRRHGPVWMAALLTTVVAMSGCGGDEEPAAAVPFTIGIAPEIVQGAVPGEATGVLVTISDAEPTEQPVELAVAADGAEVSVEPTSIHQGQVAEVVIVAEPTSEERPLEIVVTGRRGDLEATAIRSTIVRPFEGGEEVEEYARTLLGLFTSWLAEHQPELGIGPETEFSESFVCPVLVVTHYLFLSDAWEIGLSWHVMIAPHDWAEIYLRPREEATPTLAFRLRSQDGALNDGVGDISPIAAPSEVTR